MLGDLLRVPIERGGLSGLVGNGKMQIAVRAMSTKPPGSEWSRKIDTNYVNQALGVGHAYFACPTCPRAV